MLECRMQFEALKVFCDVARLHSFSQAASANGITQSATSQIVRHLEDRLNVQLVDRSTRPLQLTACGQRYFEGIKGLVEHYLEVESAIRQAAIESPPTVQVAAIYSVGLRNMNHYVQSFMDQNPGTEVRIEYLHPDRVYEKVHDGTADLGLVSFPRKSREIVSHPWRDEEIVLACSPSHPLARQRSVLLARLTGERLVHFDRRLVIRKEIDRFLREHGVRVEVAAEFDTIENIKDAVDAQAGVALLPAPTIQREVRAGTLVAVPLADARMLRPLAIIHRRAPRLSAAAARFIELLRLPDDDANGDVSRPRRRAAPPPVRKAD
jgi:DNA-binding transcriptional LysR family regulator